MFKKTVLLLIVMTIVVSLSVFAQAAGENGLLKSSGGGRTVTLKDGTVYPTRQITLIVPQKEGGGTDIFCRQLAAQMSDIIGQPIVVTNITGASGLKGIGEAMNAAPDGYTLVASNPPGEQIAYLAQNPGYDMSKLTCISGYSKDIICIVASSKIPYNTLPELIEAYKTKKLENLGAPGKGDAGYISINMVKDQAGLDFSNLITYGGSADVVSAIIRDEIPVGIAPSNAFVTAVADGDVKVICALSDNRFPTLPDIPAYGEYGYPSIEATTILSRCVFAPENVPAEIVSFLEGVIKEVVESQAFIDFAAGRKLPAIYFNSAETRKILDGALALGEKVDLSN